MGDVYVLVLFILGTFANFLPHSSALLKVITISDQMKQTVNLD